jgi:hypothetical protein
MGVFEMVFGIVFVTSIAGYLTERTKRKGLSNKDRELIVDELRQLREEVRQLRQQNNDIILALDTPAHHVGRHFHTAGMAGTEPAYLTSKPRV